MKKKNTGCVALPVHGDGTYADGCVCGAYQL